MKKIFAYPTKWFKKGQATIPVTIPSADGFTSLTPIDNADDIDGKYSSALLWALQNRHINRNIAITGPYGSGKSSLIKTFEKNNTDESLVFLNISLATFEDLKDPIPGQEENMLRLIELSILQQMFYHEEDHDIPDSRFKKTRSFPKRSVWSLSTFIFLFLVSLLLQLHPELPTQLFRKWEYPDWFAISLHYVSLFVVLLSGFYLILKSIRPLRGIQLKKFNFQDAEFGIDEKISKSILNEHLDEILYFFEVTKYTVVVIEDLDRFNQSVIFTKLRELNQLINYSKKTKRHIAFVYAVRDDMFNDKDRAKFFDFILPVVPVINSANAESKLTRLSEELQFGISAELIDNIALFVDDMRLMHNILNEFQIYQSKVKPRVADKMFAMIVYKNIYPNDFVKLSQGSGELYSAIGQKAELIKEHEKELEEIIPELKKQIEAIEDLRVTDIQDLRKIYVWNYVANLDRFAGFSYNNHEYDIDDMLGEEMFDKLRKNTRQLKWMQYTNYGGKNLEDLPKSFQQVEKEVDKHHTFEERLKLVTSWQNDKHEELKTELRKGEEKLSSLRRATIQELMEDDTLTVQLKDARQNQIVNIMLRNGYIDENYYDYISVFHEGSLSKNDQDFLLNVRAHVKSPFEHPLTKIDKLILKLGAVKFEGTFVYNFHLMDHLLVNSKVYSTQLQAMMKNLSDEKSRSFSFISGYVDHGKEVPEFIKRLSGSWPGFWQFIQSGKAAFSAKQTRSYFELIIQHAEIADIKGMDTGGRLSSYISGCADFLKLGSETEKLQKVIETLAVKFSKLDLEAVPEAFVDFICNGNYYIISAEMIETILRAKALFNAKNPFNPEDYQSKNYTFINEYAPESMVLYLNQNISAYVMDVLLKFESGGNEDQKYLLRLLNNENLSGDEIELIIDQSENNISDLGMINDRAIKAMLFDYGKIDLRWENVLDYFDYEVDPAGEDDEQGEKKAVGNTEIDQHLASFLNIRSNAEVLSKVKIDTSSPRFSESTYQAFVKALLLLESLEIEIYSLYLGISMPYTYRGDFGIAKLSVEKAALVVERGVFKLTKATYNALRENFNSLHIRLVEKYPHIFLKEIEDFIIDGGDLIILLASAKLSINQKNQIVDAVEESIITDSPAVCKALGRLMVAHTTFTVSKSLVREILGTDFGTSRRVSLLFQEFARFTQSEIMDILSRFPEQYASIPKKGKKPLLELNSENELLAEALHANGYISSYETGKNGVRIYTFKK